MMSIFVKTIFVSQNAMTRILLRIPLLFQSSLLLKLLILLLTLKLVNQQRTAAALKIFQNSLLPLRNKLIRKTQVHGFQL